MFKLYGKDKIKKLIGEYETKEKCEKKIKTYQEMEKLLFKDNKIEFYIEEVK